MEITTYKKVAVDDITKFILTCYESIGRTLALNGKDCDLTAIEHTYCESGGNFFVLMNHGSIAGTIAIKFFNSPKGRIGEIHRFYVLPSLQKQGLGSRLLQYIYDYAVQKDAAYLRGTTDRCLESAISLFQKYGAYEIPQYRKSNAEVFFEKKIGKNVKEKDFSGFAKDLQDAFSQLETKNRETLILNPVENYPSSEILFPCATEIHGLYNTDSMRSEEEKINSKIQFSGRDRVTKDVNDIYTQWAQLLGAEALTMRLLSGLHAHIILFMAITQIGDKVLLLPEIAGGHMATKAILIRLGLDVEELPIDMDKRKVDVTKSKKMIENDPPKVIFIDRSEGLIYEDFSWLNEIDGPIKVFDASQYLTNIIANDYMNPFEMGFDLILSTMHKNLPGPQRALICCKKEDDTWRQLKSGISTFVSNMHFHSIYSAGLLLGDFDKLSELSRGMLSNTMLLDRALAARGLNLVSRDVTSRSPNTHHIWLSAPSQDEAFRWYRNLEHIGILTNYRKLPYELGYGLRLGLSAATYRGLRPHHIERLADMIQNAIQNPTGQLAENLRILLRQIDEEHNGK